MKYLWQTEMLGWHNDAQYNDIWQNGKFWRLEHFVHRLTNFDCYTERHYAEEFYTDCRNAIIISVTELSIIILSVAMLWAIEIRTIKLSVK